MEIPKYKVLLIEDDEDDFILVKALLSDVRGSRFELVWTTEYEEGMELICGGQFHICLLDYRLGDHTGLELLHEAEKNGCETPIILLTGQGGYEVDVEAMRAGASDYLVKGQIGSELLDRSIRYAIERKHTDLELRRYRNHLEDLVQDRTAKLEATNKDLHTEITERKRVEEALREREEQFRDLVESAQDIIYTILADGTISSLNPVFEAITGWEIDEWVGKSFAALIHPEDFPHLMARFQRRLAGEMLTPTEARVIARSGECRVLEFKSVAQLKRGRIVGVMGTARDITERKQVEERLREQKEFLNIVLESLTHPFYVFDAETYAIKMANSAAAPHGLSQGATCHALTHDSDKPCEGSHHLCPLKVIKDTKRPMTTEHIHYDEDHNPRHVEVHGYPILDGTGEVTQIIEYSLDITVRKQMEEALREARDKLEVRVQERTAELERANEALRLDESRLEALWALSQMSNASIEDITQFALEQQVRLTGSQMGVLGFLNEDETALTMNAWPYCPFGDCDCGTGARQQVRYPLAKAGMWADAFRERAPVIVNDSGSPQLCGEAFPYDRQPPRRLMSIPVFDGERIVAIAVVANKDQDYDASDVRQLTLLMDGMWKLIRRREAEKALLESESLAAMGRALSSVAHDMKTPLIAIGGFSRIVHRHLDEHSPDRPRLEIVIKETQRLESMVKDMLDFSRPLELQAAVEDLNLVIAESLEVVESLARERQVSLRAIPADDLPGFAFDAMRMKQVIINLVMNAIQASPEGETVEISTRIKGSRVFVDVADCGCGIPGEKREEIFLPFVSTKKEGTGLGLPIVKKIVETHRGEVRIVENRPKGVIFRVELPMDAWVNGQMAA